MPYDHLKGGISAFNPVPNSMFPSDHLALSARLQLKKNAQNAIAPAAGSTTAQVQSEKEDSE